MSTQPADFSAAQAATSLTQFRSASPLVHCLTNDVVQSFTANVLLALNASPAMVVDPDEAAQFSVMADALLINVGTLERTRAEAMRAAVSSAYQAGTPWVLDPVAVGGLTFRTEFCRELLASKPAAIRGNASEIMALSGLAAQGRGVDSADDSLAALPAARELARQVGTIVAVTGAVDYVTDGERDMAVAGGDSMMTRVVGTGCALSAVVAGFASLEGDRLSHVAAACYVMALAGQQAALASQGTGSFIPNFLDRLYTLHAEDLA
ncbi:hydroxyethylthiazole kinase [Pectobacterium wasabiae]|uniref:Hydroxyethylthiazole kinase n=1 Tax=Pectobacterium wasabiae TaxID=55208 RepID=A0AAW3EHS1_9GAMM|nr:hydroxyethylthiazole kinase [Pectobacterium wasabiae]AOR62025.1 hydroxyethylthiazole kinase [Pectobacterium wasabiae CFBP 3304]EJS95364.1 Hydroxyethylthiazole kinase [Pectobacterium wasabiae CFBP 3304]KFX08309.1 hydroxyethylthiazole kinase [Pectobacterium wasabiae]KGA30944.1 hydroxyethylthiazole kinase [Pectobacterium wasabiae]